MKLRFAAVVLGCTTCEEPALAFRSINPETSFDVERADKWLSGKAMPRGGDIYRDWSRLLDLDRPLEWMAACSAEELADIGHNDIACRRNYCWSVPVTFRMARAGSRRRAPPTAARASSRAPMRAIPSRSRPTSRAG